MKKIVRLTESELIGLVRKVINEKKEKKGQQRMQRRLTHDDQTILLQYGDQSDIDDVMSLLMDNRENIKFFHLWFCDGFVDFSGIDMCELPELEFVGLKGTKSNFEELFDCYDKFGDNYYDMAKPYFKDERISDVPEPRFSMNESDLKRLVKKMIIEAKRLKNQDVIDAILDKISSQGIDSLSKTEKYILDNPDEDLDRTEDSDFMSHDLECLKSYIEFMFEPSDVKTDKDGNYVDHEGGDLYVWNNNETPEATEDCFERFYEYLSELVNSGADRDCEGMNLDDVDAHIYEFFLDEIERQKHFGQDFDELLQ